MKKQINLFIAFLLVWAPLGAQTFEKTIDISTFTVVNDLFVDKHDNILIYSSYYDVNAPTNFQLEFSSRYDKVFLLNENGAMLKQRSIKAEDFINVVDSNYSLFGSTRGVYQKNRNNFMMYAVIRTDTPFIFSKMVYEIDTSLTVTFHKLQDTTVNEYFTARMVKRINGKNYAALMDFNALNGRYKGKFSVIDDSLKVSDVSLFNTSDSLYLTRINDFLIDQQQNRYFFSEGKNSNLSVSDMQLVKLDSNSNLIKQKFISYPLGPNDGGVLQSQLSINSFWVSDSTFLLISTGDESLLRKGDIFMFIYNSDLQQKKFKRIVTNDSSEFNYLLKTATYDSLNNCYYMGATQSGNEKRFPHASGDTTNFQLTKFDAKLNVIYQRYYRRNKTLFFNSINTDSKGNVIMAGTVQETNFIDPYDIDIFILKVDSLGNLNSTGLKDDGKINSINYKVFPNPTKGQLNFRQYNLMEKYEMRVFNNKGSLVEIIYFNNSDNYFDIADYPTGVYIYRLIDSQGRVASGKLVKQ